MTPRPGIRPTSDEIDADILDIAAGLISRRGIKEMSVQSIADASGYSKAGVLKRFASKDALVSAAVNQCIDQTRELVARAEQFEAQPSRDAMAIAQLTDLALRRRGWAQLTLAAVPDLRAEGLHERLAPLGAMLARIFRLEEADSPSLERRARTTAALSALVMLALTYHDDAPLDEARPLIHSIAWSTLGYATAFPPL